MHLTQGLKVMWVGAIGANTYRVTGREVNRVDRSLRRAAEDFRPFGDLSVTTAESFTGKLAAGCFISIVLTADIFSGRTRKRQQL